MRHVRAVLVAVIALVLVAPLLAPLVTGHRFIVVDGGSMSPTLEPGDVLVTSSPTGHDLAAGRIVVVGEPGELYTHRVLEVDHDGSRARLKGDANAVADPGWVRQRDVYAVYEADITGVWGAVVRAVITPPGTILLLAATVALLLTGARAETPRPSRRSPRSPRRAARPAVPAR